MKSLAFIIAALAIPASVAVAQTTTPSDSALPYIPLIPGGGGTGTTGAAGAAGGGSATWFIDVARNHVVLCTRAATGNAAGAQTFNCTAQPVPGGSAGNGSAGNGDAGNGAQGDAGNGTNGTPPTNAEAGANPFGG